MHVGSVTGFRPAAFGMASGHRRVALRSGSARNCKRLADLLLGWKRASSRNPNMRAAVEIAFIVFLFYSNLLMGEFTASAGRGKTLLAALHNVVTIKNLAIAVVTAVVGHLGLELLREKS